MIEEFLGVSPSVDATNFVAASASVIGDVRLGSFASVWYNATVRADVNRIRIGRASNIQDNAVVHVTSGTAPTQIGDYVTVGHSAVVHGCTIGDRVLVGIGSIILDHVDVGSDTIIGAGALITMRTVIPPRSLVLGSPARVVRELSADEVATIKAFADRYLRYSEIYRGALRPETNPFYERES